MSSKKISFTQEVLVLLWKMVDLNKVLLDPVVTGYWSSIIIYLKRTFNIAIPNIVKDEYFVLIVCQGILETFSSRHIAL